LLHFVTNEAPYTGFLLMSSLACYGLFNKTVRRINVMDATIWMV